jgi:hypothetical protein
VVNAQINKIIRIEQPYTRSYHQISKLSNIDLELEKKSSAKILNPKLETNFMLRESES